MAASQDDGLCDLDSAFSAEALAYEHGPFMLRRDLERLLAVHAAGATEATVLYASRIVEALITAAMEGAGLRVSQSLCSNLHVLGEAGLLPPGPRYAAHALRRSGNAARHAGAPLAAADGDVVLTLLPDVLTWFLGSSVVGPQLVCVIRPGIRHPLGADQVLDLAWQRAVAGVLEPDMLRRAPDGGPPALLCSAALAGVLVETLLARSAHDDAARVLTDARRAFATEPRLIQLEALHARRCGELERALNLITPLYRRHPSDEETAGIYASVVKHVAMRAVPPDGERLQQAHLAYRRGWEDSGHGNAWLGVNAAATALWLGRQRSARETAVAVERVLTTRLERLVQLGQADLEAEFWLRASLAEAQLLAGRTGLANDTLFAAIGSHPDQTERAEVALAQASRNLVHLGLTSPTGEPALGARVPVCVLGAGAPLEDDPFRQAAHGLLAQVAGRAPVELHVSLSSAAGRGFARCVLERADGSRIRVARHREAPDVPEAVHAIVLLSAHEVGDEGKRDDIAHAVSVWHLATTPPYAVRAIRREA